MASSSISERPLLKFRRETYVPPPTLFRAVIKGCNPKHNLQLSSLDVTGDQSGNLPHLDEWSKRFY